MSTGIQFRATVILLLSILLSQPVWSAQDIVYSARYYYCPPRANATSHFHIYRIDPNGRHRIQLTFGKADDADPKWSPDGRYIAFERFTDGLSIDPLIVIDPSGHRIIKIEDNGYGLQSWGPELRTLILTKEIGPPKYTTIDQLTVDLHGRIVSRKQVPNPDSAAPHADYSTITAITEKEDQPTGRYTFASYDAHGRLIYQKVLTEPLKYKSDNYDSDIYGEDFSQCEPWPGHPGSFIARKLWFQTQYSLFYINPAKSIMRVFGVTDMFAWSPDYNLLCSMPGRGCRNYMRRQDGTWRVVWVDPLQIIDIARGTSRTIQGGLVNVENLDWRHHSTGKIHHKLSPL